LKRAAATRQFIGRRTACGFAFAVAVVCGGFAHGAAPRIEFTTKEASGRGVHPVRLLVDTDGPSRTSALDFEVPAGARFVLPPPTIVQEGGGALATRVFHLLVLPEARAGTLTLRGSLAGKSFEAQLPVKGLPDFRVLGAPAELLVALSGAEAGATVVVRNRGNTPLEFRVFAQTGEAGPEVVIRGDSFALAPGLEREVLVALRAPPRSRVTTEHTVAVQVEGRAPGFSRTDPVILRALFVPENQKPGPLFAVLNGSLDFGVHDEGGETEFASQLRMSGEISPGVTLEARAFDGHSSVLGSQLELAGRDTWHVSLQALGWHATVGEARAASLGFMAPGVYGRGAVAGIRNAEWSVDAFVLRDRFVGSVREAAGVKVSGPGQSWEAGAILQRSRDFTFAEEERAGAYAGLHWVWRGIKGYTEAAFAGTKEAGEGIGLAQSFEYKDERTLVDARFEHAEEGFFLQDQSSQRQSVLVEWKAGASWTLLANADRSEQTGKLRTILQERENTGGPDDPPEIIELINQIATRQETYSAGARREFGAGTLRGVFKRQERAGELDVLREFVEHAFEIEWTSRPDDPWWRVGATAGREEGDGGAAKFAELNSSVYWSPTTWSQIEGNVRWTTALSGEPQGFRREGIHGQIVASITPAKGWKASIRSEGYDYADFEPRTRIGALVSFPIGRSGWTGGVEWSRDTHSGDESGWLVVRAPFSIKMPWRPSRGTIAGRVTDAETGTGISSVLVSSGRYRAMSDATGRYQLPAMEPGARDIEIQTPGGWMRKAGVPTRVEVVAGRADSLDIGLVELGTLRGEVMIVDSAGTARAAPAGVLVAEGADGTLHETLVFRGAFTMRLPPDTYQLSFVSELPDEVGRQFSAGVTVGNAEPATVRLEAREQTRRMRRTLLPASGSTGGQK
jgi:hypothetical protein